MNGHIRSAKSVTEPPRTDPEQTRAGSSVASGRTSSYLAMSFASILLFLSLVLLLSPTRAFLDTQSPIQDDGFFFGHSPPSYPSRESPSPPSIRRPLTKPSPP